jgi:hypothetical protein
MSYCSPCDKKKSKESKAKNPEHYKDDKQDLSILDIVRKSLYYDKKVDI